MKIRWLGHSCFLVESSQGTRVVTDPYHVATKEDLAARGFTFAYPPLDVEADLVLVTHEHWDHGGVQAVKGTPEVVREPGDYMVRGVAVRGVAGEHDPEGGRVRGRNLLMRWELDGIVMCHFGDFGQAELRPEQVAALGKVDALFLPVGGEPFTVDAQKAKAVVKTLQPGMVFPMHYKTPAVNFMNPPDGFLELMEEVRREESDTIELMPEEIRAGKGTAVLLAYPM